MNRKKYIYIIIFLGILAIVFGFKKVSNNTETTLKESALAQESIKTEDVKATFIELGSVGCIPCDKMAIILKEITEEYQGQVKVIFYDVRTVFGAPYKDKFKIRAIPTQVFLDKDGKEYFRHLGFFPKEEVIKILQMQGVK
jgi:thioredoxin 1